MALEPAEALSKKAALALPSLALFAHHYTLACLRKKHLNFFC